jgi:nucleotide-binding universal stress UspA family protein
MIRSNQLLRSAHLGWEEPESGRSADPGRPLQHNPDRPTQPVQGRIAPRLANLLVPIDFSDISRLLLRWSVMVAEAFGARVSLVGVADRRTDSDMPAAPLEPRADAQALNRWRECEIPGELQGGTMVLTRAGAEAIPVAAHELSADLVVARPTSTGADGWRDWCRRDPFRRALRHLPCPLLSIDPAMIGRGSQSLVRFAPLTWQTILIWDDGKSDPASRIAWTAELSRRTHATATILRYFDQELRGMRTQPFDTRRVAASDREAAEHQLMTRIRAHDWGRNRPRILFRNGRGDAEAVRQMACRMRADLLVVRSMRDRPWWQNLGTNPISELIPAAPCPVLSVPG